jgi:succinate dehydrogenase/fumarate reductase cytochrome b subunit (b558 family)
LLAHGSRDAARRSFYLRKLHSLSGVVPVGVFLCEHLWTNARALTGQAGFDRGVAEIQALPALTLVEVFGVFLPLAFHALFGVWLLTKGSANAGRYPLARNWMYIMQRVTGVLTMIFVIYHLWEFRLQKWLFGMDASAFYGTLQAHLSSTAYGVPWIALLYMTGIAAATFHFANGLSTFCFGWGIAITRPAQRRLGWAFAALGAALFFLGADTVVWFATGSAVFAGPPAAVCPPVPPRS